MLQLKSLKNFESASRAVLHYLHERLGFDLWMVTRTEGENWIILHTDNHGYNVKEGSVLNWADSFCSQMILGNGPNVAPDSNAIPAYANAAIHRDIKIGAYMGMPLSRSDGSLFGTLCAIHPGAMPDTLKGELPLVELFSQLLSSILNSELDSIAQRRLIERAMNESMTDSLTSLYNRRGWDQLTSAEESRCKRLGSPACVISIDLDGLKSMNDTLGHAAGDDLLRRTGEALRMAIREQDIAARMGGDEFAILGVECDLAKSKALVERITSVFKRHNIDASVGYALRNPRTGLLNTLHEADQVMYAAKRSRKVSCNGSVA